MNRNNEFKQSELPEVQAGLASLGRVNDVNVRVNRLNDEFFGDKDYGLQLSAGFCVGCDYSVSLNKSYANGSGFSFDIVTCKAEDLGFHLNLIEDRLVDGTLGKSIVRKFTNDAQRANFKYAIMEGN